MFYTNEYYQVIIKESMEHSHEHTTQEETKHTHRKKLSWFTDNARALELTLEPLFEKAPHLPSNWKNVLVNVVPWISIIFGILGIIGFLGAGSLGILFAPFVVLNNGIRGVAVYITLVLGLITSILSVVAFKPLQAKQKCGWDYSFYAFIISCISSCISLIFLPGGLGGLIGAAIGAYLLFEIRGRYN